MMLGSTGTKPRSQLQLLEELYANREQIEKDVERRAQATAAYQQAAVEKKQATALHDQALAKLEATQAEILAKEQELLELERELIKRDNELIQRQHKLDAAEIERSERDLASHKTSQQAASRHAEADKRLAQIEAMEIALSSRTQKVSKREQHILEMIHKIRAEVDA